MDRNDWGAGVSYISENESKFLEMARNPISRPALLEHLEKLELLSAFLEAESETI